MKLLRGVLVIVIAALIVLGLWRLTSSPEIIQDNPLFGSLRDRLAKTNTSQDAPIIAQPSADPSTSDTTRSLGERISQELVPQLTYGSLTSDEYDSIIAVGGRYGDRRGDYLILQYCDYGIDLCRQSQREGALIAYQDALQTNASYMLKPVSLDSNPASQIQHHALQCAQKLGDQSQVNRLHALLFQLTDSQEILERGAELGIPAFESCLIEESSRRVLASERRLAGSLFGISQLPSYVLIDTRSLDWTLIPGLYEEDLVTMYLQQVSK